MRCKSGDNSVINGKARAVHVRQFAAARGKHRYTHAVNKLRSATRPYGEANAHDGADVGVVYMLQHALMQTACCLNGLPEQQAVLNGLDTGLHDIGLGKQCR